MQAFTSTTRDTRFCRVTKQRPCAICQKPDWCVFAASGAFSVCMRIQIGAVKINRHGGAIFLHEPTEMWPSASVNSPLAPVQPLAPLAVRDFAYRWLIAHSPATRYHRTLIAAPHGLLARGFHSDLSADQLAHYGALPRSVKERDQLARELLHATGQQFPEVASLQGIPGFWENNDGPHLWQPYDDRNVRLVIPVRDENGLIQACQLRHPRARSARYCWLSSAKLPHGTGSGSPLHFNFRMDALPRGASIFIVEGFLKADVLAALRPHTPILATGGVAANHAEIIRHTQARPVAVAFDQDYDTNETVCRALASLLAARALSEKTWETTQVVAWPRRTQRAAKGIDDAVLQGLPLHFLSVAAWHRQLPLTHQTLVTECWQGRGLCLPA